MGGNYRVREVAKPQTYKPKTLEPEEAPLPEEDTKAVLKERLKEAQAKLKTRAASASLPPKTPIITGDKQQKNVLVGYVKETAPFKPNEVSREAFLYLNYPETTDKNKNKEIVWKEAGYTLRVVDYDTRKVDIIKEHLKSIGETFQSPANWQKTAVVTEYDFNIHGFHRAGRGEMHLENIDMRTRHTQNDVVSVEQINHDIKNPEDIKCSLKNTEYTDAYELNAALKNQKHKVFALAIKGPYSNQAKNYAITPYNSLNYAHSSQLTFMGKSEPIDIDAYVKNLNNNTK